MKTVKEEARQLEVVGEYDVIIAGGGPGGVPAAIASARNGAKTLLIESYGFLGGLSTAGLMGPLFGYAELINPWVHHKQNSEISHISDNSGPLILGSIPLEIVRKLQKYGGTSEDEKIKWSAIRFYPEMMKHVLDEMVLGAGVDILFHTLVANVIMTGNCIDYLVLESKSGRQAVKAKVFVDATGDGDVAYFAGAEYTKGRKADGATQPMGTKVIIGNVQDVSEEESTRGRNLAKKAMKEKKLNIYYPFEKNPFGGEISDQGITLRDDEVTPTVTRVRGDGTNVRDLTRAELKTRKDIMEALIFYKNNVPGYANAYLVSTPAQIGVRETRQITGIKTLTGQDVIKGKKGLNDAVARGCFLLDLHCPLGLISTTTWVCDKLCKVEPACIMKRKYSDQLLDDTVPSKPIDYYDIPYGCLVPKSIDNLLVSGRCISADHYAMSSARVIGTCFAIGEAVGTAALMSFKGKINPRNLSVSSLREQLKKQGVPL